MLVLVVCITADTTSSDDINIKKAVIIQNSFKYKIVIVMMAIKQDPAKLDGEKVSPSSDAEGDLIYSILIKTCEM